MHAAEPTASTPSAAADPPDDPGDRARDDRCPVLRVAVPTGLRRLFDYADPGGIAPGSRVRVPFGRRELVGIVVEAGASRSFDGPLRPIRACLDPEPLLPPRALALARWIAGYYHGPLSEALLAMLPGTLRQGGALRPAPVRWHASDPASAGMPPQWLARAPAQAALWQQIAATPGGVDDDAINGAALRRALRALAARGAVRADDVPDAAAGARHPVPRMNDEQQAACTRIVAALGRHERFLLDGITGSGKTEVYLQAIERTLAGGRQALVLVPEIGLAPQTLARFADRFGAVASLHSAMADGEREQAWQRAASGRAAVLIGTRSAVFTPMPRLGLIVVDEEHDGSFKQQDGLRYSARDVAIKRAADEGIPVVLGSATPSLESLANAARGRFTRLDLTRRAGGAGIPPIRLLDVRGQPQRGGISRTALAAIGRHLDAGGQVIVYLNRRGFAPMLACSACAWRAGCDSCAVNMVLHRHPPRLQCHHCGVSTAIVRACPECGAPTRAAGVGTQRTESTLAAMFPTVPVLRMDRDAVTARYALEQRLEQMHGAAPTILVGTQMIAKGHHFPGVSLVLILNADGGLFSADFRAPERTAQAIVQVAGRAGRADRPGEVILQTTEPDHPVVRRLAEQGYAAWAETALAERRAAGLPPHAFAALLRTRARQPEAALAPLQGLRALALPTSVSVLGPVPAPLERVDSQWRAQLLLIGRHRADLHVAIDACVEALEASPAARAVHWSVDVDPLDYS